jgi:choline dehydrogenase-like flavoprotein
LVAVYPFESDWNYIATLTGDSSWSADNMRTYFEKLESNEYLPTSVVGHGYSGWLSTSVTDLILVLQDLKVLSLVISAATAMGQTVVGKIITTVTGLAQILLSDLNNPAPTRDQTEGVYQVPLSMHSHVRDGPRGFILDTASATNSDGSLKYQLDVKLNTLVTKIRFDQSGDTPRALGVDFLEGQSLYKADPRFSSSSTGTPGSVNATKEVIISGGAFNSPQILKLSGIGPRDELEQFNIPVVKDLPGVGTNLQDHHETTIIGETSSDFTLLEQCTFMETLPDPCLDQWETDPLFRGPYGTNGLAIGIIKKSSQASADEDPDLYLSGIPAYFKGYFPRYAENAVAVKKYWSWLTLKAHTHNNAGTVKLRSADPQDTPLITFNLYDTGNTEGGGDVKDVEAQVDGMELSRQMFEDLIPLDGSFEEVWPGSNVTGDDLRDFIKDEAWGHHASCTCAIGADDDEMAVLDSKFRVRGVDSLRVVDASVYPKIPGTYVVLPTYMISEKAAESILEDA